MSEGPAPAARESALAVILLAPFRAVEAARGWRRFGLLAAYGLVVLALGGMLWRRAQLAGLPDVGEPFDAAAHRALARVPDDRNAFVAYRQAAEMYRDLNQAEGDSFSNADLDWSRADPTLRGWVGEHAGAIALLREGSGRPDASLGASDRPPGPLATAEKLEVIRRLSWIGDAALFEAGRVREGGDPAGAWALLRAVVRASRHMEQAVPTHQARGTAIILAQFAHRPVVRWAEDPAVDAALLRRALADLVEAEALTPPLSRFYREEYRAAEGSLADVTPLIAERTRARRAAGGPFDPLAYTPGLEAYLRAEPERSRRVLHLLAANDLAWADRPTSARPGPAVPRLRLFGPDPAAPPAARALPPEDLARWADSALITPSLAWRLGDLELWDRNDRWSIGLLKEAVAVALFARELGRPPASPAEALRRYLPAPGDSPGRDEAEPIPGANAPGPPQGPAP